MATVNDREEKQRWVFEAIEHHEAALLRFARSIVGPSLADDVVQDTFARLCKEKRQKVEGHLAAWLFSVCRNRAIELLRSERRLQNLEESKVEAIPDSGPIGKLERKESVTRVGAAIEALPERQREALLLKLDAELSYKQIAQVMNLSVSNVGFILHRALKALREELATEELPARAVGRTS